jgi:subtilisin family serine protease/streptogramin lyase
LPWTLVVFSIAAAVDAQSTPPVAVASVDGGYEIRFGDTLVLDGTGSRDPDNVNQDGTDGIVLFEWDLDEDAVTDRVGAIVVLPFDVLQAFGLGIPGLPRSITLRVTDQSGAFGTDTVPLVIAGEAMTFPSPDYADWIGDGDGNKIDDAIDVLPDTDRVDTVILFEVGTDLDAMVGLLSPLAQQPPTKIPAISAVCVKGVFVGQVRTTIAALPTLFRAEQELEIEADLDISAASVRAAPSAVYTPDTAHDSTFLGAGINIAVLDSGVDDDHPALQGKFVGGFNAFTDSIIPLGSQSNPDDDFQFTGCFHGTHVAGIALGDDPLKGGVAPAARLLDVKILDALGQGTTATFLLGLQWCINHKDFGWPGQPSAHFGIDVVNLSVSSSVRSDGKDALSMMVDSVVGQGIVVVASGGNSGGLGVGFSGPGAADRAITVSATNDKGTTNRADDTISSVSNFGPRLDDGDGDLIEELKPDVVAPGVTVDAPTGNVFAQPASGFTPLNGSSAASAHVAGVAALILEAEPATTPAEVKTLVRNAAEPRGTPFNLLLDTTYNVRFGKGICDAFSSLPTELNNANVVWVSRNGDDQLVAIEPDPAAAPTSRLTTGSPHSLGGGRAPYGVAVDSRGSVWLANRLNATATKLNAAGQVRFLTSVFGATENVDVGGIAVDINDVAWLTLESQNIVVRIFANGNPDLTTYAVGGGPVAIATDRFGNLWVANSTTNNVTKLLPNGQQVGGSPYAVGTTPSAIVCDRTGRAYVANWGSNDITILSATGTLVGTFAAGLRPIEITLDFAGSIWVSNDNDNKLTRLDSDGMNPTPVSVGLGPRGLSVDGYGTLWVSIHGAGAGSGVDRIRTDGILLETLSVGPAPINHGDGTGFVHANSVDPDGDVDGDLWTNAQEIDAFTNPFERTEHPVTITAVAPIAGTVNGGTSVRIDGIGVELPVTVTIGGNPATIVSTSAGAVDVLAPASTFPPGGAVDVVVSRPEGSSSTLVAAYLYLNDNPIADPDPDDPNNGYVILVGDDLVLDGRSSSDPNQPLGDTLASFNWDVNGHPVSGDNPTITAATLTTFGMGAGGVYPLTLTVADSLTALGVGVTVVRVADVGARQFERGDSNQDLTFDLADAIFILQWLFQGGRVPDCLDAADINGDNQVDLGDTIYALSHQFQGAAPPPYPFPGCNPAPTPLGCLFPVCP